MFCTARIRTLADAVLRPTTYAAGQSHKRDAVAAELTASVRQTIVRCHACVTCAGEPCEKKRQGENRD